MARLVLDTNSLIQCISHRSKYHEIWLSMLDGRNEFNLIQADPDDNKFVDCAVAANAKYVVTEDRHYDILYKIEFPRVDVVGLDEMLNILS